MKKLLGIVSCAVAALCFSSMVTDAADASISHYANPAPSYLIQINGQTYEEKNANVRRPPASLTKIMSALVVLERCRMDEVVQVSRSAARETGSRIWLRAGERLTVRDLLAATLMASANDACHALADHVAGSERAFVAQMNAKARELHLKNTRFTNVCGHDNPGLYSCASDLAILADHALRNPIFADLVSRRHLYIHTINGKHGFHLRNKNRLIGRYPGALGVKTGTTAGAGQCLVALAQRGDRRVLLVLMHSRDRWSAAPALLDAAFGTRAAFELRSSAVRVVKEGETNEAPPEGTVVRDQDQTRLREYHPGRAKSP
jgi:serine-type D-Ala-D-Ala carboxypeptidase (penicillin-binding protein 5/6)